MADYLRESGVKWLWEKIKTLLSAKQDKLVSGTNIKTVNGNSLLGSGNITISGGEGGSDFDSSGTYPNLTAGKATKLATARTISLSGGASGSVSFDGSKDVDIPVTNINEGKMVWDNTYEKNKVSILDTLFRDSFGNKLAYLNPNAIKVEYSRDGGVTWLDYGRAIDGTSESISKTRLVTHQCGLGNYYQGKRMTNTEETYTDQLRITIDAIDGDVYFTIKKILIYTAGFVEADNKQVKIETQNYSSSSVDTGLWTTRGIYHIVGQPGWSAIPTTGWPNFGYATSGLIRKVRFTFYQNALSNYRGHVDNIAFLAERVVVGGNTLTKTGHLYTMDESQNAAFPANIKASDFNGANMSISNNIKGKTLNIGLNTTLSNSGTAAIGSNCSATNPYAIAMGYQAISSGYYSIAMGTVVTASANYQTVIGKNNATSNHAFVIGWGTADAKKNIFSVDTSGNVYGTKFVTQNGTSNQVVLGDGTLKALSEISSITSEGIIEALGFTPADAEYVGNIERNVTTISTTLDTKASKDVATTSADGLMSAADKVLLGTHTTKIASAEGNITDLVERADGFDTQIAALDDQAEAAAASINGLTTRVTALESSSDNTDSRYTQFIDVLNDSNACPIIPSEAFFTNATWVDIPDDNEATLDFMNEDAKTLFYNGEEWVEGGMAATALHIPYANSSTSGIMSAADKAKLDKMSKVILYTLTEDESSNHELVSLYNIIHAIKNEVFNATTNRWVYDETNSYNISVKGYTGVGSDNGITYANFNVRLLTGVDGYAIGFSGFVDVDHVLETCEEADCPLWTGYVCGKYHIGYDSMMVHAPENSKFLVQV